MTLASQPVAFFASITVSNTGSPRCVWPPLPGAVPPTILVPYLIAACEWNVPFLPVKPWQMTLVFLSIRMDMKGGTAEGSIVSERIYDAHRTVHLIVIQVFCVQRLRAEDFGCRNKCGIPIGNAEARGDLGCDLHKAAVDRDARKLIKLIQPLHRARRTQWQFGFSRD